MSFFDHLGGGDHVAFEVRGEGTLSWNSLETDAAAWARGLAQLGLAPGDRVAWFGPSSLELVVGLVAHLRSGILHVPINTRYRAEEIRHILEDSGAKALVTAPGSEADRCADSHILRIDPQCFPRSLSPGIGPTPEGATGFPWPRPAADTLGLLIYTSGTTGRSKGVALSQRALAANVGATTTLWRFSPADTLILALPLFHVHGLGLGLLGTLLRGNRTIILPSFAADAVIQGFVDGGTVFMGVPTMHRRLVKYLTANPEQTKALGAARLVTSGSAALPAIVLDTFHDLTGLWILERYGMSETGFTLSNPYDAERKAGTVGAAVPGYQVRVVDDGFQDCPLGETGQILVRGDGMMDRYWRDPKATTAAFHQGWFITGDAAIVGADGYHRIVGRLSADIIKSGGFKISAREIEDVLLEAPGVSEVAVFGVADQEWGERIVAAVVPEDGHAPMPDALASWAAERLASFKKPKEVRLMAELPRNALGKVQKHRLKSDW